MTADPRTEAARAYAEQACYQDENRPIAEAGFSEGWKAARAHLAVQEDGGHDGWRGCGCQEPTDADALIERIAEKIRQALAAGEALQCTRVWEAWRYGTMTEEDFTDAADGPLAEEVAAAVLQIIAAEVQAAKAEAWGEYAAALEAVPDYAPTEYDRGRVDQRHATIEELHARAARRDEETR